LSRVILGAGFAVMTQWKGPNSPRQVKRACSSFSLTSRDCLQRICLVTPKSRFRMLMRRFTANACDYFASNFGDKRTGCSITTTHRHSLPFFAKEFLTKNNMTVVPFLFSRLKIKLKRPPFEYNWGDRGRIAGYTEHDF
jgi:hypothetical protein